MVLRARCEMLRISKCSAPQGALKNPKGPKMQCCVCGRPAAGGGRPRAGSQACGGPAVLGLLCMIGLRRACHRPRGESPSPANPPRDHKNTPIWRLILPFQQKMRSPDSFLAIFWLAIGQARKGSKKSKLLVLVLLPVRSILKFEKAPKNPI